MNLIFCFAQSVNDNKVLWGNIICGIGAVIMIVSGLIKKRKKILLLQCAQFTVMGTGNFVLGGISGVLSNAFSIVRNLYCVKFKLHWWLGLIFVGVQAALTYLMPVLWPNLMSSEGVLDCLPLIATAIFTFVINAKNEVFLKAAIIAGQVCWGIYDISRINYISFAFDMLTIVTNAVGIILAMRNKQPKQNTVADTDADADANANTETNEQNNE